MRECWIDNYYEQRDQALASVPTPVRFFVGQLVYRKVCRTLYGQGVGRYSSDEVDMFRIEIWSSVNDLLADIPVKPETAEPFWCLGGSEPTEADITIFGFVSSILTGLRCVTQDNYVLHYADILVQLSRLEKSSAESSCHHGLCRPYTQQILP